MPITIPVCFDRRASRSLWLDTNSWPRLKETSLLKQQLKDWENVHQHNITLWRRESLDKHLQFHYRIYCFYCSITWSKRGWNKKYLSLSCLLPLFLQVYNTFFAWNLCIERNMIIKTNFLTRLFSRILSIFFWSVVLFFDGIPTGFGMKRRRRRRNIIWSTERFAWHVFREPVEETGKKTVDSQEEETGLQIH